LLDHPGHRVVVGGLELRQLLARLLQALLAHLLQLEGEGGLEDLLEEADQPLGPGLALGQPRQRLLHLAHGTAPDFVPVEEALAQGPVGPVGLLARGALAADAVDELLQDRPFDVGAGLLLLAGPGPELVEQTVLVDRGGHKSSVTPFSGWLGRVNRAGAGTGPIPSFPLPPFRRRNQPRPPGRLPRRAWGRTGPGLR